jgi:hypothetical protein
MLSWRLLLATGEARFADLAERTLFNVVATSPAPDGRAFFYANPLHQRVPGVVPDPEAVSNRAASSLREPWFSVSCCPTNVARIVASLAAYLATSDGGGLQIHQYASSRITTKLDGGRPVGLEVETEYPDDGQVRMRVTASDDKPWALSLRVPEWATGASLVENGERRGVSPGTATVERVFRPGEELLLDLAITPRWTFPDPRIDSIRGCVAVERGPVVMCVESVDLPGGASVDAVEVDPDAGIEHHDDVVTVSGRLVELDDEGWPYAGNAMAPKSTDDANVALAPYHSWGNRGPSTMRVWMPIA